MNIAFPLQIDARGKTAESAGEDAHIREMIEQLLFTTPGERVNRPDFGVGINQLVFSANTPQNAATTAFSAQGALQRFLGDVIDVRDVRVESEDALLRVTVIYVVRKTNDPKAFTFVKSGV